MSDSRRDNLLRQLDATNHLEGEVWECGVYQGDSALAMIIYLDKLNSGRPVRLFDTFCGMPSAGNLDKHEVGTMSDTSLERVKKLVLDWSDVHLHEGVMPATFVGLEDSAISLANIDVDNHDSVKACLEFIYPRVQSGGVILIDDYNDGNCHGAKVATNEFMRDKPEKLNVAGHPDPQAWFRKI